VPTLALDTSAGTAVAVVDDDGVVLATDGESTTRRHAERLAPLVEAVLGRAGLRPADLTAVVVGTGPAPFTGLRAGLVTARVLGFALGVPVLGVPSLAAVALRAFDLLDLADAPPAEVVVVTDARRHEVYWARYARDAAVGVRVLAGPDVGAAGILDVVGAAVVGRAAEQVTGLPVAPGLADPDPAALVALALARRAHGLATPVEPLYLRRPDAAPPGGAKRVLA